MKLVNTVYLKYVFGVDIVILGDKHRCAEYQLLVPLSSSPVFEGCIYVKYVEWLIILYCKHHHNSDQFTSDIVTNILSGKKE